MSNLKFDTLDSFRGLAAISVAIFHFSSDWGGYLAVDFFLVLSGFILAHSYLYNENTISPVEFISHRLARLYPLHIFTLFTFIFVFFYINNKLPNYAGGSLFLFLQNLTLTHNIGFNSSGISYNYPSWSISVEFWVNIIFILFVSRATKSSTLFTISIVGLLIIYGNNGHLDTTYKNYFTFINSGMVRGVSSFFLGILSYRVYLHYRDDARIKKYINYIEILCIALVGLIIFGRSGKFSGLDMFAPFIFMFAIAAFSLQLGFISSHLKIYKYIGEISYSIYLNQITVLLLTRYILKDYDMSSLFLLSVYLLILIGYSHLTYRYLEKPLRKKGRNLLTRIVG